MGRDPGAISCTVSHASPVPWGHVPRGSQAWCPPGADGGEQPPPSHLQTLLSMQGLWSEVALSSPVFFGSQHQIVTSLHSFPFFCALPPLHFYHYPIPHSHFYSTPVMPCILIMRHRLMSSSFFSFPKLNHHFCLCIALFSSVANFTHTKAFALL